MLAEIGSILEGLALLAALYGAGATICSIRHAGPRWATSGRSAIYSAASLLGLALLVLLTAFLSDRFQIRYVYQHSSRDLPLYLKVSALWSGQEGSLLVWSFLQALCAALVVGRPSGRSRSLAPWATVFLSTITAFFTGVTLFLSNPFSLLERVPPDGQGLNPLLRHPGMVFHPPLMYLGYVMLAVPFAFAMAALLTRQVASWTAVAHRWTLTAWLFLGLGLLLGARWAYDVLGWGGYWGWDPVENAGLMPWLTTTALLHGAVMQEERRGFHLWNLILAVFSFLLVLFGTFTTRSGVIESVHAFARSNMGPYFLAFMGLMLAISFTLLVRNRRSLVGLAATEGFLTRDGMFLLTLLLFATLTMSVFVGSVLPTITGALSGQRFEAGPAWFDQVTGPQFAALTLILGVCPLLGRATTTFWRLRERGLPALIGAIVMPAVAALAGFADAPLLIGFAFAGLAAGAALTELTLDAVTRSRHDGAGLLAALGALFEHNRRRYSGYVVHLGVILIFIGLLGTRMAPFEAEKALSAGQAVGVGPYTMLLEEVRQETAGDHLQVRASISIYRNGRYLTTLMPRLEQYPAFDNQTIAVPALHPTLRQDLYVVLAGVIPGHSAVMVRVFINPLASFLWLGGLVLLGGGVTALWPSVRAGTITAPQVGRRRLLSGLVLAAVLLLVAAVLAMWGPGNGGVRRSGGRPLVGQPAPDFTLTLLEGSRLTLSALRGKVVVVNFWASWCPPCADELPDLQRVWSTYGERGVTLVGVAFSDEEAAVRDFIGRFALTYPVGLDRDGRIAGRYGITGVPETFVVDANGNVAAVHIGPVTAEQLMQDVEGALR